jgi:YD repeat-containing protein
MGRTETYGYADGQLTSVRDDTGDTWIFGYQSGTNLLTSIEDPRGYAASITYQGTRVSSVSQPGLGTTDWSYSGDAATPEGGTTTEQEPDDQGNPDGAISTYDYRALELTAVTVGTGTAYAATTGYTYTTGTRGQDNGRAGLLASQTDQELNVTTYGYDSDGNLTSLTNPLGNTTKYTYAENAEQWGEVTQVTMPGPGTPSESYQYNQQDGNLQQSTDGNGITTKYTYGDVNDSDLTQISGPHGQSVRLQYDNSGDVTSEAIATASGTDTTKYAYNGDGQPTCQAPPASVTAGVSCPSAPWGTPPHTSGTEAFGYNGDGEQVTSADAQGGVTKTTYDQDGDASMVTTPGNTVTAYAYNAADKEILETVSKSGAQPAVLATLAYYPDGELDYQAPGPRAPQLGRDNGNPRQSCQRLL